MHQQTELPSLQNDGLQKASGTYRKTVVVNLPSTTCYKQHTFPQPLWKQDIRITRKSVPRRHPISRTNMVDSDRPVIFPPAFMDAFADGTNAAIGLSGKRRVAQLIESDERQNVLSRNASFGSAGSTALDSQTTETCPSEPMHQFQIKRKPIIRVRLPNHGRSISCPSAPQDTPYEAKKRATSYHNSVPTTTATLTAPYDSHAVRSLTPDSVRSVSSHSSTGRSPSRRPKSYAELLNEPYPQTAPTPLSFDNAKLKSSIGRNAALLTRQQTLEMYRANVKKTTDIEVQYSFAILLTETAQELSRSGESDLASSPTDLLIEARQILQRLAEKSYPFAQYYLADGYASGLFNNKGRPDEDKAFPLFVAACKHGHAEAGYRAGLCSEFGWGTKVDPAKAIQFYRQSASRNHPGAMTRLSKACLSGNLGGDIHYREGIKWLRLATQSADRQYNLAPYDLGCLHETGYRDDVFKDEQYAAQLFTQAADLGNADAAFKLGQAYEFGELSCPQDPALSIHFYALAASHGHAQAMFALCAWYMVGAPSVLERNEMEAYEWAKKAAQLGLAKAQYAIAYFAEAGIGGRRDSLEANTWYVKAAEQGEEKAIRRLKAIRLAAGAKSTIRLTNKTKRYSTLVGTASEKKWRLFRAAD